MIQSLASFKSVSQLEPTEREAMAAVYLDYYGGSSRERFLADLAGKDEVLRVFREGELAGFSTLEIYRRPWQGREVRVVYSGDTIVAPRHWPQPTLAFNWIARLGRLWREEPGTPLYWFLIVKGHRTYKYLPTYAHRFHPHWQAPEPDLQALADHLAAEKFGTDYDPARGVLAYPQSRGHLCPELAEPPERELGKPAVRFFLERNPGFRQGQELVCLCPLAPDNLRPLTRRLFSREWA